MDFDEYLALNNMNGLFELNTLQDAADYLTRELGAVWTPRNVLYAGDKGLLDILSIHTKIGNKVRIRSSELEAFAASAAAKVEAIPVTTPGDDKPWLIASSNDPRPEHPWYTPARYFARQLVKGDTTLLTKRRMLADKVVQSLTNAGIKKRGGKKPFSRDTILKALSNVTLG